MRVRSDRYVYTRLFILMLGGTILLALVGMVVAHFTHPGPAGQSWYAAAFSLLGTVVGGSIALWLTWREGRDD